MKLVLYKNKQAYNTYQYNIKSCIDIDINIHIYTYIYDIIKDIIVFKSLIILFSRIYV